VKRSQLLPFVYIDRDHYAKAHLNYPPLHPRLKITLAIILLAGGILLIGRGFEAGGRRLSDFAGYYTSSWVLRHEPNPGRMYDDSAFVASIRSLGMPDTMMIMYVNPPPVAIVTMPFTDLNPPDAKIAFSILNLLLLAGACIMGIKYFGIAPGGGYALIFVALTVLTIPALRNLEKGQLYVLMLLLVLFVLYGVKSRAPWISGASLAALLLLKYFGWMFLVAFVVIGRWKDAIIAIALCALITGGMIAIWGSDLYLQHLERLYASFASFDVASTHLPSVPALIEGLFVRREMYNPFPVADIPVLAGMIIVGTLVAALSVTLRIECAISPERMLAAILALSVIYTPLAGDHHYILLVPAVWILIFSSDDIRPHRLFALAAITYALFGWFPQIPDHPLHGISQLLIYPRLYGGIALWALLLTGASSGRPESSVR